MFAKAQVHRVIRTPGPEDPVDLKTLGAGLGAPGGIFDNSPAIDDPIGATEIVLVQSYGPQIPRDKGGKAPFRDRGQAAWMEPDAISLHATMLLE